MEGDEYHSRIENRKHVVVGRMRSKNGSAIAKITALLRHSPSRDPERLRFGGNIEEMHHLPDFMAFFVVVVPLPSDEEKVHHIASRLFGELLDRNIIQGQHSMGAS